MKKEIFMIILIILLLLAVSIYKVNFEKVSDGSNFNTALDNFSGAYFWILGGVIILILLYIWTAFLKKYY